MSQTDGNGATEWVSHSQLIASDQAVIDARGYKIKRVRAVMPCNRGVRVRVLAEVEDGGVVVGGTPLHQLGVEFEAYVEGGQIVSKYEVRR